MNQCKSVNLYFMKYLVTLVEALLFSVVTLEAGGGSSGDLVVGSSCRVLLCPRNLWVASLSVSATCWVI